MKKLLTLCLVAATLCILFGYDTNDIVLQDAETTIIKADRVLRYDLTFRNTGREDIKSEYDYPGHQRNGFEIVIRPNEKLEALMEMEQGTKFKKMMSRGGGGTGVLSAGSETHFHVEYQIKGTSPLDKVEAKALDATLILLDGHKVVKEFPLEKFME